MVDLFCAVVGDGRIFPVEIDLNKSVGHLKKTVIEETPDFAQFGAPALTLFLARRGDTWLKGRDDDMMALRRGDIPDTIQPLLRESMLETSKLSAEEYFGKDFTPGDGDIHVLVQMPTAKKPRLTSDGSTQWLEDFHQKSVPSTLLPLIPDLAKFVSSPLLVRIGLAEEEFLRLHKAAGAEICDKLVVLDENAPCQELWEAVLLRTLRGYPLGRTENAFIAFWDSFIGEPLATLFDGPFCSTERNSSASASTGTKRPDLLFTYKDVCVFRGEEKAPGVSESKPRTELSDKLVWSYGTVPYVFGYTAVGYECTLFAIYSTDQRTVNTEPIAKYDTTRIPKRFQFLLALMQLSRLFESIVNLCPYTAKDEFKVIRRERGAVIRLHPMFVVKDFTNACNVDRSPMSTQQVKALEVKFKELQQLHVPGMEEWKKTSECGRKFTFEPRGFLEPPNSLHERALAIRCVLETLVILHRHSWIHRDIRWPNVLRARDAEPRWFLIDLTDAARSPQKFPDGTHLNKDKHAPEIFVEGGQHTTAVDMWSVGYLIQNSTWNDLWKANEQRRAFLDSLLEEDPTKRPTARRALKELKELMRAIPND